MHTHKIINGEQVALTTEEIAEIETQAAAYIPPTKVVPTKEELFSQMQSLQTQMQMLQAQIANLEK